MMIRSIVFCSAALLTLATSADAQFRRGILSESREVTLFPVDPPALLLPPGSVEVTVRNASPAPARIVERVREYLQRQLTDNDSRLTSAEKNGDVIVTATLTDWTESRRSSTKYVSERRQVGTRQVKDSKGNWKTEPVYEYGRNKPSVVINGTAGLRLEVRARSGGDSLTDQSARHSVNEEHLVEEGPPSRDAVEDILLDNVIKKAAGRISPGRSPVRVLLARSDEVDPLNSMPESRRWQDWLGALAALKPHRDARRDSYRLHNIAVAHEALAYEANANEDSTVHLGQARALISQASQQNPKEKYITESAERIDRSTTSYRQLTSLYAAAHAQRPLRATAPVTNPVPATPMTTPVAAAPTTKPVDAPPAPKPAPNASSAKPPSSATTPKPTAPAPKPRPTPSAPSIMAELPPSAVMTNQDVIDLRKAGLDDDNLIAAIKAAKGVQFDLSPPGLKSLLNAKVTNRVIAAMRARTP